MDLLLEFEEVLLGPGIIVSLALGVTLLGALVNGFIAPLSGHVQALNDWVLKPTVVLFYIATVILDFSEHEGNHAMTQTNLSDSIFCVFCLIIYLLIIFSDDCVWRLVPFSLAMISGQSVLVGGIAHLSGCSDATTVVILVMTVSRFASVSVPMLDVVYQGISNQSLTKSY